MTKKISGSHDDVSTIARAIVTMNRIATITIATMMRLVSEHLKEWSKTDWQKKCKQETHVATIPELSEHVQQIQQEIWDLWANSQIGEEILAVHGIGTAKLLPDEVLKQKP